jgi:hypothetical protein
MRALITSLVLPLLLGAQLAPAHARERAKHPRVVVRWHFKRPTTWTLGLRYSTDAAIEVHKAMVVMFPDLVAKEERGSHVTLPSKCDNGEPDCSSLKDLVLAVDNVARTVGSIHWDKRIGDIELVAGVILPPSQAIPPSDLDVQRLTLRNLPPLTNDPGMLNLKLTVF